MDTLEAIMKRRNFHLTENQVRQLKLLSSLLTGRPKVASMVREAIDDYITKCYKLDVVQEKLKEEKHPRLIDIQKIKDKA